LLEFEPDFFDLDDQQRAEPLKHLRAFLARDDYMQGNGLIQVKILSPDLLVITMKF